MSNEASEIYLPALIPMANQIVELLVGPEISIWVKLLIIIGLMLAVLVWWKKAYWEN